MIYSKPVIVPFTDKTLTFIMITQKILTNCRVFNRYLICCPLQSACSLESNLEGLAGVLEADLPNYKSKILRLLCTVYVCKRFVSPGDNVLSTLKCFGSVQKMCLYSMYFISFPSNGKLIQMEWPLVNLSDKKDKIEHFP